MRQYNKNYNEDEENKLLDRYNQLKSNLGFNEVQSPNNNYILKLTNISNKLRSENSKHKHAQTYQQSIEQSLHQISSPQYQQKNVKEFVLNNQSDQLYDHNKYLIQEKKRLEKKLIKIKELEISQLEVKHQENIKKMQTNMKSQFENEIIDMKEKISHVNTILNDYLALKDNYSDLEQQLILTTKENSILREEIQIIKYNHTEIISELQQNINSLQRKVIQENQLQLQTIKPQKLNFSNNNSVNKDQIKPKYSIQTNNDSVRPTHPKKQNKTLSFSKDQLLEDNQKLYQLVKNFKEKITLIEYNNQILSKQLVQSKLNQSNLNTNQNNSVSRLPKKQIQQKGTTKEKKVKKYAITKKLNNINEKLTHLDDNSRELYSKNKQLKSQLKLFSVSF